MSTGNTKSSLHQIKPIISEKDSLNFISSMKNFLKETFTRQQVLERLQSEPEVYHEFLLLSQELQEKYIEFCMGIRGLPVTYDPFFKKLFNPYTYPNRFSMFVSDVLGIPLKVKHVIPNEGNRLSAGGSLVIMDIVAELEDGSTIDVEIQKIGYHFPGQRSQCYAADMIMRQYNRVKDQIESSGGRFSFKDMKKVYILILMEKSSQEFLDVYPQYIHQQEISYSSGVLLDSISNITYLSLDIFNKAVHNIVTKQDAWLKFLSSDDPKDIMQIIQMYPCFGELYEEINLFRTKPKELVGMFSDALRIMDANTVQLMIEEQKAQIEAQKDVLEAQKGEIEAQKDELKAKEQEIMALKEKIAMLEKER